MRRSKGNCGRRTLIVIDDVAQMITTGIMILAHTHRVVGEIDIAVIACIVSMRLEREL